MRGMAPMYFRYCFRPHQHHLVPKRWFSFCWSLRKKQTKTKQRDCLFCSCSCSCSCSSSCSVSCSLFLFLSLFFFFLRMSSHCSSGAYHVKSNKGRSAVELFLGSLRQAFAQQDPHEAVKQVLEALVFDKEEWTKFVHFS